MASLVTTVAGSASNSRKSAGSHIQSYRLYFCTKNFLLSNGETEQVVIRMKLAGKTLESVIITDERDRRENSLVRINPKNAITLPSTTGGIEALIKTYVGSNNELTSQLQCARRKL